MREVDNIISGGTILTLDENDRRIDDGAVAISGDTIVAVGKSEEILNQFVGKTLIEAKNSIIMPGLVNCHTHAAMTCFRGIADDLELITWLNKYIFPAEAKNVNPELAYWGSLLACAEMIKSGTTTFCDMYVFEDETARAAKQAGLRCLLGEGLFDFPSPNAKTPAEGFAYIRKLIEKWHGDPLINIIVEPHSLYTCSPSLLAEAKKIADEYNLTYAVHLLETQAELSQLQKKFAKRPTEYLRDIGYLTDRFLAYHCVYMDDADMCLFAEHGCKVVHNPESNMKLSSGVAPVPSMLLSGITVGLGTDGCASNNNLDMFQEMDTAAKLHKVAGLDPMVMDARTVIHMATIEGAKSLRLGHITGSLAPGKKADIITIDLFKPHLTPMYNEYSHLVYAAGGADVDTVIINGQLVMKNRRLLTIDERKIITKVKKLAVRIKKSLPAFDGNC